jgi:DEAD/DEAH box helicase domain-containing protein
LSWVGLVYLQYPQYARLLAIDPALASVVSEDRLRLWIFGLLQRYRELGALSHSFVAAFARSRLWGKKSHRKIVRGRETFPLHGKYVPGLLTEQREVGHNHVLAVGRKGAVPWSILWVRRALGGTHLADVSDVSLADLHRALLEERTGAGLFIRVRRRGRVEHPLLLSWR